MKATAQTQLRDLLMSGIAAGAFPAAAAWISREDGPPVVATTMGLATNTLWDLASLTKPMVTATDAMLGVASGTIALTDPVISDVTLELLLNHRSGLPAWVDLAALLDEAQPGWHPGSPSTRAAVWALLDQLVCSDQARSRRHRAVYSDLGYMLAARYLQRRMGRNARCPTRHLRSAGRRPMPTGTCSRRQRELVGEVNDTNAWVLGGHAGHAGAFGTVCAVGEWARDLERSATQNTGSIDGNVVRDFWRQDRCDDGGTWVVGFDTPTMGVSSGGQRIGRDAVGHLGFTGTSVWIDRAERLVMVLLSNRVALGPAAQAHLRAFRPRFHDQARVLT